MKSLFVSFFILLSSCCTQIRGQIPAPGANITHPSLDNFVGTWVWTNGTNSLVVQFKKVNYYYSNLDYHEDVILGCYKYIKEGELIEDNLAEFIQLGENKIGPIVLKFDRLGANLNKLRGNVADRLKHDTHYLNVELNANAPVFSIQWIITRRSGFVVSPTVPGFTLPQNIVLVKQ